LCRFPNRFSAVPRLANNESAEADFWLIGRTKYQEGARATRQTSSITAPFRSSARSVAADKLRGMHWVSAESAPAVPAAWPIAIAGAVCLIAPSASRVADTHRPAT